MVGHEIFRQVPFPFPEGRFPPELGAVIQRTVLDGTEPARIVIHDDEGSWAIGDGINDPNLPGANLVSGLRHLVDADPSLAELATLPPGHIATRDAAADPWRITLHQWPEDN